jgi:aminoglycoside/choline kinase family phosphotransferase
MKARDQAIEEFLAKAGWAGAVRAPLAGDASARRYERVRRADGSRMAVLMDAPPEPGEAKSSPGGALRASGYSAAARLAVDCRPFVAIAHYLAGKGLSAPALYAEDIPQGLLLLEDLGDDLFVRLLGETGAAKDEARLYMAAVDLLAAAHAGETRAELPLPGGARYALPRYEPSVYQIEADLLIDWYLPALRGAPLSEAERDAYHAAWAPVLGLLGGERPVLVLRDYHAGNLLWLPERPGPASVGLLDFQDGLLGSAAYDLVSLLQDARRDVAPALELAMLERYIAAAKMGPGFDEDQARLAYAILGAQRNAKIVGIFTRLSRRDGKPVYLRHLPRVWRYLTADLAHPALAELRRWFDDAVPHAARIATPRAESEGFAPLQKAAS